ncbi:hypothetical protein LWC35_22485 [Pseudonocardia kujensis]|uniref:thiolase family protein n=1 Tax=Pseudonocardia kujensis TaxID=1128675 RepID=UPI001E4A6594|nr:beta-ketoacyl synthase N-terminal-like domain-containing protein [Pseudonocardia kujensis]MCE0765650.1 hypothetical protein [Pseudonocardia kujensis]
MSTRSMSDVVVCDPVRTPVGVDGGVFATLTAADLATQALQGLIARTGLGEGDVDDVVLGYCYPTSEAPAIGRVAALNAGLGIGVAGMQLDRRCGSGLQAVLQAALTVGQGWADLVVAGGVEAMSQAEYYACSSRASPTASPTPTTPAGRCATARARSRASGPSW